MPYEKVKVLRCAVQYMKTVKRKNPVLGAAPGKENVKRNVLSR